MKRNVLKETGCGKVSLFPFGNMYSVDLEVTKKLFKILINYCNAKKMSDIMNFITINVPSEFWRTRRSVYVIKN